MRFHPDSSRLLLFATDDEYCIRAWKLHTSSCVAVLRGHYSAVIAMQFTPGGSALYRWVATLISVCDVAVIQTELSCVAKTG